MSTSAPPGFGDLLRHHRITAGLTQEELAERAGLSARGVQDVERGLRRTPHPDTVRRLIDALNLQGNDHDQMLAAAQSLALHRGRAPQKRDFDLAHAQHVMPTTW